MVLFYTTQISESLAIFSDQEARHIKQSLRKEIGAEIDFVDGLGQFYRGIIKESTRHEVVVEIREQRKENKEQMLSIGIAPTKNIDRFEWLVEKVVEMGVAEIIPMQCAQSERKTIKLDRLKRICVAAMKQSMKATLPTIHPLTEFNKVLEFNAAQKGIATLQEKAFHINHFLSPNISTIILIGPEGGFRDSEIALATSSGYQCVTLGSERLRTETAGVFCAAAFHLANY